MNDFNRDFIEECRERLLVLKTELMNKFLTRKQELSSQEFRGDEIDMTSSIMAENELLASQSRIRHQLMEIEFALARIDAGQFGMCEETEEPIELDRLKAIPWTRLSIEGAEIRESSGKTRGR